MTYIFCTICFCFIVYDPKKQFEVQEYSIEDISRTTKDDYTNINNNNNSTVVVEKKTNKRSTLSLLFCSCSGDLKEVYNFMKNNPQIIAYSALKGSGASVWGPSDLISVRFAGESEFQTLGDKDSTLGVIFSCVGIGCLIGPLVLNKLTKQVEKDLLLASVIASGLFFLGYTVISIANDITLVLLGTVIKSSGSAILWVYSTILLQIGVPQNVLGRVFSFEMALHTLCEGGSQIFVGYAIDHWVLSPQLASWLVACYCFILLLFWSYYYRFRCNQIDNQEKNIKSQIV